MSSSTGLNRTFKLSWVYAIAVGSAVGWGAFVLPYQWLSEAGLFAILSGFLIGTLLISIIAINYGYATQRLPVTGGGIVFALAALGKTHAFIAGWSLMLGYMGIVALNASAVTLVLRLIIPDIMQQMPLYQIADCVIYVPEVIVSSLFLSIFAYLNIKNTAFSGKFQFLAVVFMLIAVTIILVSTAWHFFSQPLTQQITWYSTKNIPFSSAVMMIVAFAPWAYIGFDSIPQLAGEFNFTPQKIMKLLIASVFSATFLYIAMVCASAFAFGNAIETFSHVAWATGSAIESVMGKIGLILLVIAVSMGVLTGLNGFYMASSRVFLTMGRSTMLPSIFAKLHPKYNTPYIAIYTVMAICFISPWFGRAALLWIVDMTSVGIAVTFFYTCFCAYKLGKTGYLLQQHLQQPNTLQANIGLCGCIIAIGFLGLLIIPFSPAALSLPSWYALFAWLFIGIIFYALRSQIIAKQSTKTIYQLLTNAQ